MICPKCHKPHAGPHSTERMHAEGCRVLMVANTLGIANAKEYLRSQWLGGGLELSGWCPSCIFLEVTATAPGMQQELERAATTLAGKSLADIEEQYVDRHVCTVIPFPRERGRVARDLLDIGSPKPGGAS